MYEMTLALLIVSLVYFYYYCCFFFLKKYHLLNSMQLENIVAIWQLWVDKNIPVFHKMPYSSYVSTCDLWLLFDLKIIRAIYINEAIIS